MRLYYGVNKLTNKNIFFDINKLNTHKTVCIGDSHSGKSTRTISKINQLLEFPDTDIILITDMNIEQLKSAGYENLIHKIERYVLMFEPNLRMININAIIKRCIRLWKKESVNLHIFLDGVDFTQPYTEDLVDWLIREQMINLYINISDYTNMSKKLIQSFPIVEIGHIQNIFEAEQITSLLGKSNSNRIKEDITKLSPNKGEYILSVEKHMIPLTLTNNIEQDMHKIKNSIPNRR